MLKLVEEVGELTRAHLKLSQRARVDVDEAAALRANFEDELADVLGQVLVLSQLANVDPCKAIDRKWLAWHPDRQTNRVQTPP
jgi:NTP pyrophosphatase (non-canonical NTP hydrolase)